MPKIGIKAKSEKTYKLIEKAIEKTIIIQRQKSLIIGRWDFVVFGPGKSNEIVVRKGYAEQATIKRAPVYIATLGNSSMNERQGIPIEDIIEEDLPEEYLGLEIHQINPLRPLIIEEKKKEKGGIKAFDKIVKKYESENIAVIQAPNENNWPIAVLKYLNLCDQDFPDTMLQAFYSRSNYRRVGPNNSSDLLN